MISKGEIKRCGFKPVSQRKDENQYTCSFSEGTAILLIDNLLEGKLSIYKSKAKGEGQCVFRGYLPSLFELQIILRCTKIT